jgi:hypothetical protein
MCFGGRRLLKAETLFISSRLLSGRAEISGIGGSEAS